MAKINYDDDDYDPQVLIVFLFLGIALGAAVTFTLNRFAKSVPYTIVC